MVVYLNMSPVRFSNRSAVKIPITACLLLCCFAHTSEIVERKSISLSIHADGGEHRENVKQQLEDFTHHYPHIEVELIAARGIENYSLSIDNWLKQGQGPSVIWWVGGSRVAKYAEAGLLQDLSGFWQTNPTKDQFSTTILEAAMFDKKLFGLPISASVFSLYYRKSVLKKLNIKVPTTWDQLIDSCRVLRHKNVSMFALGTKDSHWILHGWFDFLNLRLHGLTFYKELLSGQHSFLDKKVRITLEYFKQLIDLKCFNLKHQDYDTWDVFPSVLRGYSAMILATGVPEKIHFKDIDDIGIATFPNINPDIPNYTVTPVDVFVVPHYTELTPEITTLLKYLTTEEFQSGYVEYQRHITAITRSQPSTNSLVKMSSDIVKNSPGGIQFLDRNANIAFSSQTPSILIDFFNKGDIDNTMHKFEKLRIQVFENK